jgi:hypothetical protein
LRQLLVARDFKKHQTVIFSPVNDIFNVMKAAVGNKHQVVVKIVKQLDELMVRDPYEPSQQSMIEEDSFEIPRPSYLDMEVSINS